MNNKRKGCSIIIINSRDQILLFLRDNKSTIPYPNMWDFLGGQIEEGETAEQCIVREIKEEINLDLTDFNHFVTENFPDRIEYVFSKKINLDISQIILTEGQKIKWFSFNEIKEIDTVFGLEQIIDNFMKTHLKE